MKAKYTAPLTNTKVPATRAIRRRSRRCTSSDSRKSSTHIAQGLKPSSRPRARVNSGSPRRETLSGPTSRVSTLPGAAGGRSISAASSRAGALRALEADEDPAVDDECRHAGGPDAGVAGVARQVVARGRVAVHRAKHDPQLRPLAGELSGETPSAAAQCGQPSRTKTSSTGRSPPACAGSSRAASQGVARSSSASADPRQSQAPVSRTRGRLDGTPGRPEGIEVAGIGTSARGRRGLDRGAGSGRAGTVPCVVCASSVRRRWRGCVDARQALRLRSVAQAGPALSAARSGECSLGRGCDRMPQLPCRTAHGPSFFP